MYYLKLYLNLIKSLIKKYRQSKIVGFKISASKILRKFKKFSFNKLAIFEQAKLKNSLDFYIENQINFLSKNNIIIPKDKFEKIKFLTDKYINHYFNLLGSGWTKVDYYSESKGINDIKIQNQLSNDQIKTKIIENFNFQFDSRDNPKHLSSFPENYEFIDWQKDFRSGFVWEYIKSSSIKFGEVLGADIKIPWELGRLQHLPTLALNILNEDNEERKNQIFNEIKNQIKDFKNFNEPGFGTQWINGMDIGIRAVSIILTLEILNKANLNDFDNFAIQTQNLLLNHLTLILGKLEWSDGMRGNHYFSNICSIIIISSALIKNSLYNIYPILNFAILEFNNELIFQFNEDGSNFEGSIPYHFFTFEMALTALTFLNDLVIQDKYKNENSEIYNFKNIKYYSIDFNFANQVKIINTRIKEIGNFSENVIQNDFSTPILGDIDSGRYVKLIQMFENEIEITNNWSDLISYYQSGNYNLDNLLKHYLNPNPIILKSSLNHYYEDFGLYILKNKNYSFYYKCGKIGQNGKGGHDHNDQLSFILNINDIPFVIDIGTYNYTALPKIRNQFRSTLSHNTLSIENLEQNEIVSQEMNDLFWLYDKTKSKFDLNGNIIKSFHSGFGKRYSREIVLNDLDIEFKESIDLQLMKSISLHLHPNVILKEYENLIELSNNDAKCNIIFKNCQYKIEKYDYSPEYGTLIESKVIRLLSSEKVIDWKIRIL